LCLRLIALGSGATKKRGERRSNNTFVSNPASAVFWSHAGAGATPNVLKRDTDVDGGVATVGDPGTRTLRGEPFVSIHCTLMMNSNFPDGLSIFHSSYPSTFRFTLSSLDAHVEGPFDFLSAEAQDEAIAKYGVASRVWYKPLSAVSCGQLPTQNDATGKRLMP